MTTVDVRTDHLHAAAPLAGGDPSTRDLRDMLPHRHPMLLVDRVLEVEPRSRLRAVKAVTSSEPWFDGPEQTFPQTLLVESWCQAACLLATWDSPNPDVLTGEVMLFGAMSGLTFGLPVRPGSILEHFAEVSHDFGSTMIFTGSARCDGREVLSVGSVTVAFRPAAVLRRGDGGKAAPETDTPAGSARESR